MWRLLLRRGIYACMSLLLVTTATFALMKAIPGDPFQQEQALPEAIYQALRSHYGLNDPWYTQYLRYLSQLITFDFGPSLVHTTRNVTAIIKEGLPTSALLGAEALLIAIPCGLFFGLLAAFKQQQWQDLCLGLVAIIAISVPSFVIATILQYFFGIQLGWMPIARWGSFSHTVLPALSLAALPTAFLMRMTRTKMINEWQQGYVTTAYAKGLPTHRIIIQHTLPNILAPVLSYLGPLTANILTGSFIVEKIYSIPGLGYWFVTAVTNRDYPLIMGLTVFYCALLLLTSLMVDYFCLLLDPRLAAAAQQKGSR